APPPRNQDHGRYRGAAGPRDLGSERVIVLDTHVLVWADTDDRKLGRKTRARIEQHWPSGQVAVASISFWEIGLLQARGRLRLPTSLLEWRESLIAAGIVELPLDG